jgi:hypothetical protein
MNSLQELKGELVLVHFLRVNENGDLIDVSIKGKVITTKICDYYFHEKDETINITVEVKPLEELPDELSWEDFIEVPIDDITKAHERKD